MDESVRPRTLSGQTIPRNPRVVQDEGRQQIPRPSGHLRRFTAVLVGTGFALRTALAIGTLGISEGLGKLGKLIGSAIYNKATGMHKIDRDPVTLNLPGEGGGPVQLNARILPQRIPRNMSTEQCLQQIQGKINTGHQLVTDLLNGNVPTRRCTVEDMTNIMWYLQVKGEQQKGNYSQGALSIPDPDHRIRDFLDTCKEGYQRESSHISGFQVQEGGKHRGIDCYGSGNNMQELLPYGRSALLYGSLNRGEGMQMPNDRLWMKIESHGAWLTSPKGGRDVDGPGRTANRHDVGAFWGHTFSFLATRGQGSAAGTFKERIPDTVKNDFKDLCRAAPQNIRDILTANTPTDKAKGLRVMYQNAKNARDALPLEDSPLRTQLNNFIQNLEQNYDNLDVRIGNEVILTQQDLR
jgi:hypothetical protein